jgi:predicted nucleic acid-binding protein
VTVLVDTSALYALLARDDQNHEAAATAFAGLRQRGPLVTHNYVVVETVALVQHRFGLSAVRTLLDLLGPIEVIWVDEETHRAALAALLAAPRRRLSLVDRVSFEVMHERGITQAFAFDPDFAQEGFVTLTS